MAITALPTPPSRADAANFADRGDAFLGALPAFQSEANALATDVNAKQVIATTQAGIATTQAGIATAQAVLAEAAADSASATANAVEWVSGTTYVEGFVAWSPINYLSYRRKTNGTGTIDPSLDDANWASLSGAGIAEIRTPVITSPANNATGVSLTPTINGSAFAPAYSVDTRDFRQLQIDIAAGDFTSPVVNQQANANNITVSTPLAQTTAFKARIRDVATTGVSSAYSSLINFTTLTQTVPDAPTIGTATQTSPTTATVAFTAPANDGGSTITSYTATSSPAGGTGTLNQAGSGTITVTGLTSNTAYTFTVTATNALGTSALSAASNSITTPLAIGDAFGGGFFAGQISTTGNSVATHHLVVAPKSVGEFGGQWKTTLSGTAGTLSEINGEANTAAMIAAGAAAHPCGNFCNNLVAGGFSDWYKPARSELEICYFNLKPTTTNNLTNVGINNNAVPARPSNYTSFNPAQTSVAAFQTGGAEAFISSSYWASTELSTNNQAGRRQFFDNGDIAYSAKTASGGYMFVRAIRKVPV